MIVRRFSKTYSETTLTLGLLLALMSVSCAFSNKPENSIVADAITALRQELPFCMEGLGKVRDIDYEDNSVLFLMRIQEDDAYGMNVNKISNNKVIAKEILSTQIGMMDDQKKDAIRNIAEQSFGLRIVVNGSNSNQGIIDLSPKEISEALSKTTNKTLEDYSLEMVVLTTKLMLPARVDQVTTWTDTRMTDSTFEYVYRIDDYSIDMNAIEISSLKSEKITVLRQNMDIMGNVVYQCKSTRRNLIYRYIGNRSNKTIDIVLTPYDLDTI